MKRIVSIILLLSYVLPFWGVFSVLQFKKYQIKREVKAAIKQGLAPEELMTLKFSKNDAKHALYWRHAKEFEFEGQLYDVVERHEDGDSVSYLVYWDYPETKIKTKLDRLLSAKANHYLHDNESVYISFFDIKVEYYEQLFLFERIPKLSKIKYLQLEALKFKHYLPEPNTPPPI